VLADYLSVRVNMYQNYLRQFRDSVISGGFVFFSAARCFSAIFAWCITHDCGWAAYARQWSMLEILF